MLHALLPTAAPLLVGSMLAAAPSQGLQSDPILERHLRNTYLERKLAFEQAWDAADGARRARVRAVFEHRASVGLPALYRLSARDLTDLVAVLEGAAQRPDQIPLARRLAESLDVRLIPGAFSATRGDRGDEVIARVLPLYARLVAAELPEWVQLTLFWVGPGGRELKARSEPVHRAALELPGFEMYFHAPASEPGTWHLVPEVEVGEAVARGRPVPVECVADLFPRYDRLAAGEPQGPGDLERRRALEGTLAHGVRDARHPSVEALLAGTDRSSLPPTLEEATEVAPPTYVLLPPEGEQPTRRILVVAPSLEDVEWSLLGERGEAWRALAAGARAEVLLTGRPASDPAGPDALELMAGLNRERPLPIILVVQGPDFSRLRLRLGAGEPSFQGLVLDTVLLGEASPRPLLAVPTLLFEPLEEDLGLQAVAGGRAPLHWVRRFAPPPLASRELPLWIGAWLALEE